MNNVYWALLAVSCSCISIGILNKKKKMKARKNK